MFFWFITIQQLICHYATVIFYYINILLILQEFLNFASYNLIMFHFIQCGNGM
mgnify:CR=1 FL=1